MMYKLQVLVHQHETMLPFVTGIPCYNDQLWVPSKLCNDSAGDTTLKYKKEVPTKGLVPTQHMTERRGQGHMDVQPIHALWEVLEDREGTQSQS